MKKKLIASIIIGITLSSCILFVGCTESNDDVQAQQTEQLQKQANSKIGMPNITNFYEKETLKTIMEECDKSNLITYVYTQSTMTGKFLYVGEAIGYAIPYGTEYTNPDYVVSSSGNSYATLPQADPNGLYKATDVRATWVMLIDPTTKQAKPFYSESDLSVYPSKLPRAIVDPSTIPADY